MQNNQPILNIEKDDGGGEIFKVNTSITKPDVKYHWIDDEQLENFLECNAPISWTISFACGGYVLGNIREIINLVQKLEMAKISIFDLLFFGLFCIAATISIVAMIYACFSKSKAKKILEKIRSRKTTPITAQKK